MKDDYWRVVVALLVLLVVILVTGKMDYEDARLDERIYCEGVQKRQWPDYRGTYYQACQGSGH